MTNEEIEKMAKKLTNSILGQKEFLGFSGKVVWSSSKDRLFEALTQVRNEAIEEAVKVVVEKDEFLGQNKDIAQAIEALKDDGK